MDDDPPKLFLGELALVALDELLELQVHLVLFQQVLFEVFQAGLRGFGLDLNSLALLHLLAQLLFVPSENLVVPRVGQLQLRQLRAPTG